MSVDFRMPPRLRDGDLLLRAHRLADAEAVHERCLDPVSLAWTTIPRDYTRQMAVEYIERMLSGQEPTWFWALDVDGEYAGTLDLRFSGLGEDVQPEILRAREAAARHGRPEPTTTAALGFVMHPAFRGRGLMGRAVRLAVDEVFREGLVERVLWQAAAGNRASFRSVQAAGFPEFIEVPALLDERGLRIDGWVSVLTREEWAARR